MEAILQTFSGRKVGSMEAISGTEHVVENVAFIFKSSSIRRLGTLAIRYR
jgi:hypothetical protein